ncbi:hypothetical protein V501_07462 [Pseudogymnoascus sp. VKM F-4519 (FW-2642)]|nr:hypothetical protein V501_07462 [Pseudogymnoascus sp. VKM F-4519 (FW-2642)]
MSSASSPLPVPVSLRAVVLLLCLLSQVPFAQSTICYDVTGLQSEVFFPCEPDAEVSSCCYAGDICFSNGLCSPSAATKAEHPKDFYVTPFFWNACSDPTFQDPKCFSGCFNVSGNGVKSCPEAGPNAYCCFGYSGCDYPSATYTTSTASSIHTSSSTSNTHTLSSTSSTHVPSSTSTSEDSTATTTEPEAGTPTNTSQGQETSTHTNASQDQETSTPTNASHDQGSKSSAVPIGVGVGVGGAVVIAVAAIAIILLRRRRQKAPYLGPQLKYEYETKPDEAHYEMMTTYNAAELSNANPVHELPARR